MAISYSNSPLGITLYPQVNDRPSVGRYSVVGNTFSSLFSNKMEGGRNPFEFNVNTNYNSDIKTSSIITDSESIPAMRLKYSDFAYLKNLGVYPNNRLIIARRFDSGVEDDLRALSLTAKNVTPISTLISWVPDNSEFITTKFGEEWVESEASFKNILNDLGKDVLVGDNKGGSLGNAMAGAGGIVPLPGFTEGLQYEIFKSLGMTDIDAANLPLGNPNLIRQSKRRKTLAKEEADSGLKCKFSVEMTVEYEQKFINGVDPTIVYYDIIANALTFGTSESKFQFRGDFVGDKFKEFLDNIGSGDPGRLKAALLDFVGKIAVALKNVGNKLVELFSKSDKTDKKDKDEVAKDKDKSLKDRRNELLGLLTNIATTIVAGLVSKYKLRILGVVNSLTGSPSAPWHVTVGNPRRPIFSSGDMVVENVEISMGKLLSFNDLPSSIKLKLTLESARNLGAQEIYKKFNCGKERSYVKFKYSFAESDVVFTPEEIKSAGEKGRIDNLQQNAVSSSNRQSDVTKIGNESFPDAIKNIPGVQYQRSATPDLNGEYALVAVAKTNQFMRNPDGSVSSKVVENQFYPNGRQILLDDKGKRIGSGSWKIKEDGSVVQTPDDNKFVGGTITNK